MRRPKTSDTRVTLVETRAKSRLRKIIGVQRMKWREHPILKPLIPPGYPDDVPAIVHEGFRAATTSPEKVWIRISDMSNSILTAVLFDNPSTIMRIAFPNMPANSTMNAFSTFCPLCGDPIVLRHKDTPEEDDESPSFAKPKKWYEFWK